MEESILIFILEREQSLVDILEPRHQPGQKSSPRLFVSVLVNISMIAHLLGDLLLLPVPLVVFKPLGKGAAAPRGIG